MSSLLDYKVSANLITSELLICTLTNEELNYESKLTPESFTSGILNFYIILGAMIKLIGSLYILL